MDREILRQKSASRRSSASPPSSQTVWHCDFCVRDFVQERSFEKHKCPGKMKLDELRSPVGQVAYGFYCGWMRTKRHSVQSIETFGESRNYSSFIKFATWAEKTKLPNPDAFIQLMVSSGIAPSLWSRDEAYSIYLKVYDEAVSPDTQVVNGITLLEELASEANVPVSKVFDTLSFADLSNLIQKRKLTHWLLISSSKFRDKLMSLPGPQKQQLADVMQLQAAVIIQGRETQRVKEFSAAMKELGL